MGLQACTFTFPFADDENERHKEKDVAEVDVNGGKTFKLISGGNIPRLKFMLRQQIIKGERTREAYHYQNLSSVYAAVNFKS